MYWNLIWKSPGFVPFGANLTHFVSKSGDPAGGSSSGRLIYPGWDDNKKTRVISLCLVDNLRDNSAGLNDIWEEVDWITFPEQRCQDVHSEWVRFGTKWDKSEFLNQFSVNFTLLSRSGRAKILVQQIAKLLLDGVKKMYSKNII